ncbi:MAG: DUF1489 domain-containing protein [Pseudomonadota bacterium]
MDKPLHMIKLCVGAEKVAALEAWQASRSGLLPHGLPRHVTRMWPKRADEIAGHGSLFWVFKGVVLARQKILRFEEVRREDGIRRCGIIMDPEIVRTEAITKRPFQGWRYLSDDDAPRDLSKGRALEADIPPRLMAALAEIGVR